MIWTMKIFCSILFSAQFAMIKLKNLEPYANDEELNNNIPDGLYNNLSVTRGKLVLDFHIVNSESQCFQLNQLLMDYQYFFCAFELRKAFHYLQYTNAEKKQTISNFSLCPTENFNGYNVVKNEREDQIWKILKPILIILVHHAYSQNKVLFYNRYDSCILSYNKSKRSNFLLIEKKKLIDLLSFPRALLA